jgi:hypothetical protein
VSDRGAWTDDSDQPASTRRGPARAASSFAGPGPPFGCLDVKAINTLANPARRVLARLKDMADKDMDGFSKCSWLRPVHSFFLVFSGEKPQTGVGV